MIEHAVVRYRHTGRVGWVADCICYDCEAEHLDMEIGTRYLSCFFVPCASIDASPLTLLDGFREAWLDEHNVLDPEDDDYTVPPIRIIDARTGIAKAEQDENGGWVIL